jgi:hypothetical protein
MPCPSHSSRFSVRVISFLKYTNGLESEIGFLICGS